MTLAHRLKRIRWPSVLTLSALSWVWGCASPPELPVVDTPTLISAAHPLEREITEYRDFTGNTAAEKSVEIRARVSGYLTKVAFEPGAMVKEGDLLFEIDSRPYEADLAKAKADVAFQQARVKQTEADYARAVKLSGTAGAVSRQEIDKVLADRDESRAAVDSAQAQVKRLELNVEWCRVTSPISGRVSRNLIDKGNLVSQDRTLLTTVVTVDPVEAYFDIDEQTVLYVQQLIADGKFESARKAEVPVYLGKADEVGFPHRGVVDFVDNQLDPTTGTLKIRAQFPNADDRIAPGLFVRLRVPIGKPFPAITVAERAVLTGQATKYLLVAVPKLTKDGEPLFKDEATGRPTTEKDGRRVYEVRRREEIVFGPVFDGMRVITSGLKPSDLVIVEGLQRVREGMEVFVTEVEMPVPVAAAAAHAEPAGLKPGSQPQP